MKRLGFKPSVIRNQRNFHLTNDNINTGSFGTFNSYNKVSRSSGNHKEAFDLVNQTQTNKVYVCVDRATQKFAIGYDDSDSSFEAPVLVKPLDINDRSQWLMANSDSGIMTFFYTSANHFRIDFEKDNELGIIPIKRSDKFKNAIFTFGNNGEIFVKLANSSDPTLWCLAFKKGDLEGASTQPEKQFSDWDQRYQYYKDESSAEYKKEGFLSSLWNAVNPFASTHKEGFDIAKEARLELVNYEKMDRNVYSYQWIWYTVWDVRTATNLALETEQIKDLQGIDKEAIDNSTAALTLATKQLSEMNKKYNAMVKKVKSHTIGSMWV